MRQPGFRGRAWLVKNGVSFREAFELDEVWADALAIAFGEIAGRSWSWGTRSWGAMA